jgi:hypothetical protein
MLLIGAFLFQQIVAQAHFHDEDFTAGTGSSIASSLRAMVLSDQPVVPAGDTDLDCPICHDLAMGSVTILVGAVFALLAFGLMPVVYMPVKRPHRARLASANLHLRGPPL